MKKKLLIFFCSVLFSCQKEVIQEKHESVNVREGTLEIKKQFFTNSDIYWTNGDVIDPSKEDLKFEKIANYFSETSPSIAKKY